MKEEKIKQAFSKVKEDMQLLSDEIYQIKLEIYEIKQLLESVHNQLNAPKLYELTKIHDSTPRHINTTHPATSTHNSTHPQEIEGLKPLNLSISTGNEGVSTDRQTDTSTDRQTQKIPEIPSENISIGKNNSQINIEENIQEASEILNSLDKIKKQIRLKFKRITPQEMAVFSTIYQLEEQDPDLPTYKQISLKLGLSESSIRDYVQRITNKGIPIKKTKIDNKKIILQISPELKKVATLSTIIKLRGL